MKHCALSPENIDEYCVFLPANGWEDYDS